MLNLFNDLPISYLFFSLSLISLIVGSFLNVVIYRLPLMMEITEKNARFINLWIPRSFCPSCKMTITALQNIPLLSFFISRGRCKSCKTAISIRYPLVEAITWLLSISFAWYLGFNLTLVYSLLLIWILIPLFFIDIEHQLLPDQLTYLLLWLGLLVNIQSTFTSLPEAVFGAVLGYLSLWSFIKLFYLLTGKIGMGHGDFKLFAALGAWFGWSKLAFILFLASILGTIIGTIYLIWQKKTRDTPIPFGPFLCMAGLVICIRSGGYV